MWITISPQKSTFFPSNQRFYCAKKVTKEPKELISRNIFSVKVNFSFFHTVFHQHNCLLSVTWNWLVNVHFQESRGPFYVASVGDCQNLFITRVRNFVCYMWRKQFCIDQHTHEKKKKNFVGFHHKMRQFDGKIFVWEKPSFLGLWNQLTVWKIKNIPLTQILREINFSASGAA